MAFTPRQVRAMGLIADTFATGGDGVPSPTQVGSHELALRIAEANPRTGELRQLKALLDQELITQADYDAAKAEVLKKLTR